MSKWGGWDTLRARLAREQTILISIIGTYFLTGKLGLLLAFDHPAASVVFPASGVALSAFLILGYRIWPAVFGAASLVYIATIGPVPAALAIAVGNTLEGILAAYLVNRYAGGRHALQTPRNSLRFAGMVVLSSTIVSPTLNTLVLIGNGLAYWPNYGSIWMATSIGSLVGMLLFVPPIVLYSQGSTARWRPSLIAETIGVGAAVVAVGLIVFYGTPVRFLGFPTELLCIPVLLWPAFRLGRRAAAAAILVLASIAIFGTLSGYGPFVRATPHASLLVVQCFLGITAVMTFSLAALASEYSSAEAQLRELAVTDPLTGLPNYRRLLEVLGIEIARADRHQGQFAVVFFDMDELKRINDELGHLTGSRAVCRFAETLRAACRTTDTAARYGGDEFVAILSDTDLEGANLVVQRIAERLDEDSDEPRISVSAGVAVYPRDGGTPTTLLSAADRALYTVKAEKANARRRSVVGIREWTATR